MRRLCARLALVVVSSSVALLVLAGAYSLATGRSLRPRPFVGLATLMSRGDGLDMATDSREQFRVHPDPRVGVVLRRGEGMRILDSTFSADRLGVRGRPEGEPDEAALRVVILGDSVAFGAGNNDDETLAYQLERMLTDARGPAARPVACFTVAATGWNHRNAVSFLLDHYERYRPDVVVFLAVENDLTDTYGVYERGTRRIGFDVCSPQPLLVVNDEPRYLIQYYLAQRLLDGDLSEQISPGEIGVPAITCGLGRESQRRYDENAESLRRLSSAVTSRGGRVALLYYTEQASHTGHTWFLRECLLRHGIDIPEVPGLTDLHPAITLENDAHPNAAGLGGLATWVAQWLIARGWLEGDATLLPPALAEMEARRMAPADPARVRSECARLRAQFAGRAVSIIDLNSGRGIQQVYGGINADGTLGPRFLGVLRRDGLRLRIVAESIEAAGLRSVRVVVTVDGEAVGQIELPAGSGVVDESFDLPPHALDAEFLDIGLIPDDWATVQIFDRIGVASIRLRTIEIVDL